MLVILDIINKKVLSDKITSGMTGYCPPKNFEIIKGETIEISASKPIIIKAVYTNLIPDESRE